MNCLRRKRMSKTTPAGTAHAAVREDKELPEDEPCKWCKEYTHFTDEHFVWDGEITPPSPKEVTTINNSINQIDAFTDFINEWINTNVKVFSRKENNHDGKVL
jgi:hypothetical protein